MPWEIIIAFGITIILWAFTRNIILSFNLSLFSLPISGWLLDQSWVYVVYPVIIVALMLVHFGPVIVVEINIPAAFKHFSPTSPGGKDTWINL